MKILLVANPSPDQIGCYFYESALDLGHEVEVCDIKEASGPLTLSNRIKYRLIDKRPTNLDDFSALVRSRCEELRPDILLSTGCAPITASDLASINDLGTKTINYSTDDPWSRSHKSKWFLAALQEYFLICSPREHTFTDFKKIGCDNVRYVPFGYHPKTHYPATEDDSKKNSFSCDVLFYGGADSDRIEIFKCYLGSDIDLNLYGGYWNKYFKFRKYFRGFLKPQDLPAAVAAAKVTICISRTSNRDSHAMRSYEVAAMGACILTTHSTDHQRIYGDDGDSVKYFTSENILQRTKELLENPELCSKLRTNVYNRIRNTPNTYADRLTQMIELSSAPVI